MSKFVSFLLILTVVFLSAYNPATVSAKTKDKFMGGQVIVKFKPTASEWDVKQELKKHSSAVDKSLAKIGAFVINVPQAQEEQIKAALSLNPKVEYSELNYIAQALDYPYSGNPDDLRFANAQWGLENTGQSIQGHVGKINADVNAITAWQTTTGLGVKVAVLDSGVDMVHPDLSGKVGMAQDFTGSGTTDDMYGHGTHVAGILGAKTNNGVGIAGACPDCILMNGKVLDNNGSGAYSWIANGIIWAVDNGAKVINLSLGGSSSSATLQNAITYALSKNVVVVAAAGNSGSAAPIYPAGYTNVVAVGATNNLDQKASFSNFGTWVAVTAPGEGIFSTFPTHTFALKTQYGMSQDYDFGSGTSMATPLTSGVAALIWSTSYGTSADAVRNRLFNTSDAISGTGTYWKYGRINAAKAVAGAPSLNPSPSPSATPLPSPSATLSPTPNPTVAPTVAPTIAPTAVPTPIATVQPTMTPSPSPTPISGVSNSVKVNSITYQGFGGFANNQYLRVSVNLVNNLGKPVTNATVTVSLKNTTTNQVWNAAGATNSYGTAIYTLFFVPSGNYTTTITNVAASGLSWDGQTPANSFKK